MALCPLGSFDQFVLGIPLNISFGSAFFKAYFHLIRVFFLRLQNGYNTNLKCPKLSTWASALCWQGPYFPASWGQTPSIPGPPAAHGMGSNLGTESSNSHLCSHSRPRCHPSSLQVFQLVSCLGPHPQVCISTATRERVWKQWFLSSLRVWSGSHKGLCHGILHLLYPPCTPHPWPSPPLLEAFACLSPYGDPLTTLLKSTNLNRTAHLTFFFSL